MGGTRSSRQLGQRCGAVHVVHLQEKSVNVFIATPALPSWMTDFVPSTDEPEPESSPVLQKQSVDGKRHKKPIKARIESPYDQLAHRLASHTDVEDINLLTKELGLDLQKAPELSSLVFKHILRNNISHDRLIQFLEQPMLNVTAAQNLLQYVRYVRRRPTTTSEMANLRGYIKRAVALGLVSEDEIRLILRDEIDESQALGFGGTRPTSKGVGFLRSIWDGLRQSSVLPTEDLHGHTFHLMMRRLNLVDYEDEHRALAQSIVAAATQSQLAVMTKCISHSLLAWCQHRTVPKADGQELPHGRLVVPGLTDYIDSLPEMFLRSSLATATMILLSRKQSSKIDDEQCPLLFKRWMNSLSHSAQFRSSVLGSAEWQTIERRFARPMRSENLITYLEALSELDQCKFIVRTWVHDPVKSNIGVESANVCSAVMRSFDELCDTRGLSNYYINLILALSHENQLNDQLLHDILCSLRKLSRSDVIIQIIEVLQAYNIPVKAAILGAEVGRYSHTSVGVALRIFELHQALTLEGCVDLAIALINDPLSHVDITLRLLKRHRRSTTNIPRPTDAGRVARGHLLHQMATAFAHATHLNPSVAFRKVHRCYLHLRRDGLPLQPTLVRALTHAGIVRSLQAGESVSTKKIQWILSKVREVEGQDVEKVVDEVIYNQRGQVITTRRRLQRKKYIQLLLEKEVYSAAGNASQGGQEDAPVYS